jgi:hypothetical protein
VTVPLLPRPYTKKGAVVLPPALIVLVILGEPATVGSVESSNLLVSLLVSVTVKSDVVAPLRLHVVKFSRFCPTVTV